VKFNEKVLKAATEIAEGCQGHESAYCSSECPMHTDVIGYVDLIKEGKVSEALLKIREKLFLPGTLGRICAHPCEKVCRRNTEYGQPISIAALKRYAADKADKEEFWDISKDPATGKKVAVIGAGPAGAQAALDLAKKGHEITIFEKLEVVGGMMRVGIPEYRLPRTLIDFEYSYLNKLGVVFKLGVEIGKDIQFDDLIKQYDAIIVAHGAHKGSIPSVKGKETEGVTNAVDFLKEVSLTKKSHLAGKKVVVIGGGDVAMDCARSSFRVGVQDVHLVSLENQAELPASIHEQKCALEEGVVFNCGWGTEEILSKEGRVSGIRIKECLSVFDAEGRFSPTFGNEEIVIPCDTVIFATGQIVEDITAGSVEQTRGGRYVVDKDTLATKAPNVFVAGDAVGGTIVVEAMALGRKASISVDRYLKGMDLIQDRDLIEEYSFKTELNLPLPEGVIDIKRYHTRMLPANERKTSFAECDLGFDDSIALEESSRCLKCECKGCMKECIMLNDFTHYPGELFNKFLKDGNMEPLIAYSCNMCNQCTIVCPEEYKLAEVFGGIRKDLVKANNGKSPLKGHGAIDIHQLLGFSKLFTVKQKGGKK